MHYGSFSYPFSLTATEGTCSGLEFSGWSIPVSFMLVLVTLSFHRNFSYLIELFQHNVYGRVVIFLFAQRNFLHTFSLTVVYIEHKSLS